MNGKFVAYYRVSTRDQNLGLPAQRKAVMAYLNGGDWELTGEFEEKESGKRSDNRPQFQEAMKLCRLTRATLVIAKLDRLSRNSAFLNNLLESGVTFICCDMPHADPFTIRIMAALAQKELEMISERTKAGLQTIKDKLANGEEHISKAGNTVTGLGGYRGVDPNPHAGGEAMRKKVDAFDQMVAPMVTILRDGGATLDKIASTLNGQGVLTFRGKAWSAMAVKRVLDRLTQDAPQSA